MEIKDELFKNILTDVPKKIMITIKIEQLIEWSKER